MQVWAITGGRRGNDVLVLGVAQALGVEPRLIHTQLNAPWRWLSPYKAAFRGVRDDPTIAPPYPDLVLASGRQAAAHARFPWTAFRRRSRRMKGPNGEAEQGAAALHCCRVYRS